MVVSDERALQRAVNAAVAKLEEARAKDDHAAIEKGMAQIVQRLAALSTQFGQNVLKDEADFVLQPRLELGLQPRPP